MDIARLTLSPDTFGWLASSLTLVTFMCADMRRLRCAALGANAAFIAYGALAQLWPVLALHLLLVPVNLWRLAHAFRAGEQPPCAIHPGAERPARCTGRCCCVCGARASRCLCRPALRRRSVGLRSSRSIAAPSSAPLRPLARN